MIAEILRNIDSQYILVFCVVVISIDVFLTQSEILLWFAISMIISQVLRYFGVNADIELWSIPILALVLFSTNRQISKMFSPIVLLRNDRKYVGEVGVVSYKKSRNLSSLFRKDADIGREIFGQGNLDPDIRVFVLMKDGKEFVCKNMDKNSAGEGDRVKITSVNAGVCEVVII